MLQNTAATKIFCFVSFIYSPVPVVATVFNFITRVFNFYETKHIRLFHGVIFFVVFY